MLGNLANLQPGDTVEVDTRRLFMDDPKWVPVTFIRWANTYDQFPSDQFIPGVRNKMVISVARDKIHVRTTMPGHQRVPLLDHMTGTEYMVSSQDARVIILP